jgi:integrase/recombinase XerD
VSGPLEERVSEYLALRRSLGYKLERAELLLGQFVAYLDTVGVEHFGVADALAWATLPEGGGRWWWAQRLSVVRGFATWLQHLDPAVEVPPTDLLAFQADRAVPYLYSQSDITALMDAAASLKGQLRQATYQTLIGLLAVTGMRVGEARRLDRGDVDLGAGTITVRHTKFDKSRLLPLHPTTTAALADFLSVRDRLAPSGSCPAVFVSPAGTRLLATNVESTFRILVSQAGLEHRGAARPRMHDLRHSFIINAVLDGYQRGLDVQARLAVIATYAGHVDPKASYWYLTASPELMAIAGARLDTYLGAGR